MRSISKMKAKEWLNLLLLGFLSFYTNALHPIVTANDFGDPFTKPD
jgi:hypothetical protein